MKFKVFLVLAILYFLVNNLFSQSLDWTPMRKGDGGKVGFLVKDNQNIWAGAGRDFFKYNINTHEKTIIGNMNMFIENAEMTSFGKDPSGLIWIGTNKYGLVKIHDEFVYEVVNAGNSPLQENIITSILVDFVGTVWFGTANKGIAKFNGNNWNILNTSNSGLPDNHIKTINIDKFGNIWICTNKGISKYNSQNWQLYNQANSGIPDSTILSFAIDSMNNKWIGTTKGITRFDGTTWQTYNSTNSTLVNNTINTIAIDQSQNVWVGTNRGYSKFDGIEWTNYYSDNLKLPYDRVNSIAIDQNGDKWIGNYYNGVVKISDNSKETIHETKKSFIGDTLIKVIVCDKLGNTYLGAKNGLVKINEEQKEMYTVSNSGRIIIDIQSMAIDRNQHVWIIGRMEYCVKFDGKNILDYTSLVQSVTNGSIRTIAIDKQDRKWIAGYGCFIKFEGKRTTLFGDEQYFSIAIDQGGVKWVGEMFGLYKYDGVWTRYVVAETTTPVYYDYDLVQIDKQGAKWFGFSQGVGKYDGTWKIYNDLNSAIPSKNILSLQFDPGGNLWIGANLGLTVYNGTTFTRYTTQTSGLPGNRILAIAFDSLGNQWISTDGGVVTNKSMNQVMNIQETQKIEMPKEFSLSQNYPNPFNPTSIIKYSIKTNSMVSLKVYNTLGQDVANLVNEEKPEGSYEVNFDGSKLSSGVYFYTLRAGSFTETKKLILVK